MFPPTEEHPVRVDFFGDTVEEIHYFSVADQRSSEFALTEVVASPCRELLLTDDVRRRAFDLTSQHPELIEMLDKIAQGHAVDGMEALPRPWSTGWSCWSTCCPRTPMSWSAIRSWSAAGRSSWSRPARSSCRASWAAAAGGGQAPIDLGASSYQPLADVRAAALARGLAWWTLSPFTAGPVDGPSTGSGHIVRTEDGEIIDFSART